MSESTRAYIYRVLTALSPLLIGYGFIDDTQGALWLGVAGAVLSVAGNGLAAANSEPKPEKAHWDHDTHTAAVAYALTLNPEDHPVYKADSDRCLQACGITDVREAAELIGADPDEVS